VLARLAIEIAGPFSCEEVVLMGKSSHRKHGEGSVYKRADGRYSGFITLENGKRKYFYGRTEKEVLKKIRQAIYEREQGTLATGPQQTVKQFLEHWLEKVHKLNIRPVTYEDHALIVRKHLIPALGHIRLQKLTTQHVQSLYTQKLEEGLSPGRVKIIHAVLHGALRYAVRTKLVTHNVSDEVDLPPVEKHEIQPLAPEEAQLFLQKIAEHPLGALLTVAVTTGMRQGELLALRWQDVDLKSGELQVRRTVRHFARRGYIEGKPKTESSIRRIVLPDFVVEVLKQHRMSQLEARLKAGSSWVDRDLVFCRSNGDFIPTTTLQWQFARLLEKLGFPRMRFHDLRHTAATLLLSMGVPMRVVQDILGHSEMGTTANIYSHVLPSMHQEAMEKMDKLLGRRDLKSE
jgi:integrase